MIKVYWLDWTEQNDAFDNDNKSFLWGNRVCCDWAWHLLGEQWSSMAWWTVIQYGLVNSDPVWLGEQWSSMAWWTVIQYGLVNSDPVWLGEQWSSMAWWTVIQYGLVNSDPVWLGEQWSSMAWCSTGKQPASVWFCFSSPFSSKSRHIKGSKEHLFILTQTHNLKMFGVIPFAKLQNDTSTTVK